MHLEKNNCIGQKAVYVKVKTTRMFVDKYNYVCQRGHEFAQTPFVVSNGELFLHEFKKKSYF